VKDGKTISIVNYTFWTASALLKYGKNSIFATAMENGFVNIHFMNWENHLKRGLWLVDFWAEWCSACIAQDKIYHELAERFGDKLHIGKINVSDNRLLADRFGVRNIPFLLLMKNGEIVLQMPGIQSKEYLINQIKRHLS
jgi:thioredoxin 1